jgi:hypothetical protein
LSKVKHCIKENKNTKNLLPKFDNKSIICYTIGIVNNKGYKVSERIIKAIPDVGYVSVDSEASPGVGRFAVVHFASGYDMCGFDTFAEAWEELELLVDINSKV